MAKQRRELKDIRQDVKRARDRFLKLAKLEKTMHEHETGAYDVAQHIPKKLGKAIVVKGRRAAAIAPQLEAAIRWPLKPDVHLPKLGTTAEDWGDWLEGYFANWVVRTDPRGMKKNKIHSGQVRDAAAYVWCSVNKYEPPTKRAGEQQEDYDMRLAQYDAGYSEMNWENVARDAVGLLDINGEVTFACVELKITVLDLLNRFGPKAQAGEEDPHPLEVLGKKFSWLRGKDGRSPDSLNIEEFLGDSISLTIADDGAYIYCYVDQGKAGSPLDIESHEVAEVYENTFGRPSLVPFYGIYRPGLVPEQMYEGLLWPFCEVEMSMNITRSLILTIQAERRWVQPAAKDTIASTLDPKSAETKDEQRTTRAGDVAIPGTDATLQDVSNIVDPSLEWTYETLERDWAELKAPLLQINPSPDQVEKGTAAVVLYGGQQGMRIFGNTVDSVSTGFATMFRMLAHHQVYGRNPHLLTSGADKNLDKGVSYTFTGTEYTKVPAKAGETRTIPAKAFAALLSSADSIKVIPVAETEQQRQLAARNQAELLAMDPPQALPEDVQAAMGVTNVSERLAKLAAYQRIQLTARLVINAAARKTAEVIANREGRDPNIVLMLFAPEVGGAPGPAMATGQNVRTGYQYQAPATPTPPAGPPG